MNTTTNGIAVKIILNHAGTPSAKVADAELHFTSPPLGGLKLIGFAIWESRSRLRTVTLPARQYRVHGETRAYALLRSASDDQHAHDALRTLILAACKEAESARA